MINLTNDIGIPGERVTTLTVSDTQSVDLSIGGALEIRDSSDNRLAVFDALGNVNILGTLTQNTQPTADVDDFVIENSSGGLNLVITNPEGNMIIKNNLVEGQGGLSPTLNSFIVENSSAQVVAYVNNTGGLYLTRTLIENVLFE